MENSTLLRLLSKVRFGDGCWEWTAHINAYGYGIFSINCGKSPAHRVMYEQFVGPIPEGLQLDHLCRNRKCVRPAHLEPVTCKENIQRGYQSRGTFVPHGLSRYTNPNYKCRCPVCRQANTDYRRERRWALKERQD